MRDLAGRVIVGAVAALVGLPFASWLWRTLAHRRAAREAAGRTPSMEAYRPPPGSALERRLRGDGPRDDGPRG